MWCDVSGMLSANQELRHALLSCAQILPVGTDSFELYLDPTIPPPDHVRKFGEHLSQFSTCVT